MKQVANRPYKDWKMVCVYELQAYLPNEKILSYVGQSFDFSERVKEHFFGIKHKNVRESTSPKFVSYLATNKIEFSQVALFIHFLERAKMGIDSDYISEIESELILKRKNDKNYISCNIKD